MVSLIGSFTNWTSFWERWQRLPEVADLPGCPAYEATLVELEGDIDIELLRFALK